MNLKDYNLKEYRVPDIKEFVKGFEYEVYSEGYFDDDIEDFCGWYKYKFETGKCFRDIQDIEEELLRNNIRVKTLKFKQVLNLLNI